MFLGLTQDDGGIDRVFLEADEKAIVQSLKSGNPTDYFFIRIQGNAVTLQPVTLVPGPRAAGRSFEIVEIQANGVTIGSAEVVK